MHDLTQTFGALLIGLLFSALLFGCLTLQTYLYYRKFHRDPLTLKFAVGALWILNTSHLGFISHAQYFYLVTNYLRAQGKDDVEIWSLLLHVAITAIVICAVQCFFAERLWSLSGHNVILIVSLLLFMFARLGIALAMTVVTMKIGRFSEVNRERGWIVACLASAIPSDIAICVAMTYFLYQGRRTQTDGLFNTIMLYTLQTGLVPCLLAIATLICYLTMQETMIFIAIHFVLGQLYTSSMLVILNARTSLHGKGDYNTTQFSKNTTEDATTLDDPISPRTHASDWTQQSHRHLTSIDTRTAASLEFRGVRPRSPSTPVYHVVDTAETLHDITAIGTLTPLPEGHDHFASGASDSARSHTTGPSISWESLQSAPMVNCDLGDIDSDRRFFR